MLSFPDILVIYVIQGWAELELEGQKITLETGDSWTIPQGASHRYHIMEEFIAVEAISPPAFARGRDEATSKASRGIERPELGDEPQLDLPHLIPR